MRRYFRQSLHLNVPCTGAAAAVAAMAMACIISLSSAPTPAYAAGRAPEPDRSVPDGTLTYKIVLTGHGSQKNQSGFHLLSVKKATTVAHEKLEVESRLHGHTAAGEITAEGKTDAATLSARAPKPTVAQKLEACYGDRDCMMRIGRSLTKGDVAKTRKQMSKRMSLGTALSKWDSKITPGPCQANVTIANSETVQGKYFDSSKGSDRHYTQQVKTVADSSFDCGGIADMRAEITADPNTGYYLISFPAHRVHATRTITNDTGGGTRTKTVRIDFPAFAFKGLKLPASGKPIHGTRRVEDVAILSQARRLVAMSSDEDDLQPIAQRPPVSLDAVVTWTFTPDED